MADFAGGGGYDTAAATARPYGVTMRFTSGGTGGPRFVPGRDASNNVYGFLPTAGSAEHVAEAFHRAGWRVRASGETEFEVEHTYAEVNLVPGEPVFFSGIVIPERVEDLIATFAALGLRYNVELYGPEGGQPTIYRS